MALNTMGLGFLFTARDEASATVRKLERSIGSLEGRTKTVSQSLTSSAIGFGIMTGGLLSLRSAFHMAKEAGAFEQALVDVKTIAGGTAADLNALRSAALEAGIATQFGPEAAVKGLRDLAAEGYNAQDSIKLLKPVLDLAAASLGELSPEAAGGVAAQTLKAFKLGANDAALAIDKLVKAANMSAIKPKELPLAIGRVARGATLFGADETEALSAVGLARNVIGSVEMAATGVSVAMERLVKPKIQKALRGIGVDVIDHSTGGFKKFLNILNELTTSPGFTKLNKAGQASLFYNIFGSRGAGAANAILTQLSGGIRNSANQMVYGAEAIQYFRGSLDGASGAAKQFSEAHLNTLPGQLLLLKSSFEALRIVIGTTFIPIFQSIATGALKAVNAALRAFLDLSPETQKRIGQIALAIGTMVTAFGAFVGLKFGIAGMTLVMDALGVSLGAIFVEFLPLVGIFAAVAAAGYLLYQAYKTNFGGFATFMDSAAHKIGLAVKGLGQLFSSGEFSGDLMKEIDKVENSGVKSFVITLYGWGSRVIEFFKGIGRGFESTYNLLKPVFAGLLWAFEQLGSALGLTVGLAEDNAASFDLFGEGGETLGKILGDLAIGGIKLARLGIELLTEAIKICRGAASGFGGAVGGAFNIAIGAVQALIGLLGGDGSLLEKGLLRIGSGALKTVVGFMWGLAWAIGAVFDGLNRLVGINSNISGAVTEQKNHIFSGIDNDTKTLSTAINQNAEDDQRNAKKSATVSDWSNTPANTMPFVAAGAPKPMGQQEIAALVESMKQHQTRSSQGDQGSPILQTVVQIDGQTILTATNKAKRSDDAGRYMSVSSGSPE